jgi:hypothetical protein
MFNRLDARDARARQGVAEKDGALRMQTNPVRGSTA